MTITKENRGTLLAAKSIVEDGLNKYVNDGVRFGYFSEDEDPKQIGYNVLQKLIDLELYEVANVLKNHI